jgi:peptide/nickel transport system substrate-binding protein
VVPKDYYEKVGAEGFCRAPEGTGPWKFVSRSVKEEIRFKAFDGY